MRELMKWLVGLQKHGYETVTISEVLTRISQIKYESFCRRQDRKEGKE